MASISPASGQAAPVRLDVRVGGGRAAVYEVGEGGFLVGSVPGCDLRLPGANLPPLLCLISRHGTGATLRKLAAIGPVAVNGRPASPGPLADGDRVSAGTAELVVRLATGGEAASGSDGAGPLDERLRQVERRERALAERAAEIEADRRRWFARREEIEAECGQQVELLEDLKGQLRRLEAADGLEVRERNCEEAEQGYARRAAELGEEAAELERRRQQLEAAPKAADLEAREAAVTAREAALASSEKQYQADRTRLDRLEAAYELRQKQLAEALLEVDRKAEQLRLDGRDLEEQAAQLDEQHARVSAEAELAEARLREVAARESQMQQRTAAIEAQQTMLATLRTRLERMREELQRQEQTVSDGLRLQEANAADLAARRAETEEIRGRLDNDRELFDQERRRFDERRTVLEKAVTQLRLTQETVTAEQAYVQARAKEMELTAAEQAEQAAALLARGEQLEEVKRRLDADRQGLEERQAALARSEQVLAELQEQVRRRNEELDARAGDLDARQERMRAEEDRHAGTCAALDGQIATRREELDRLGVEMAAQSAALDERRAALAEEERLHLEAVRELGEAREALGKDREVLVGERAAWEAERREAEAEVQRQRQELERRRGEGQALLASLPDLELRARSAVQAVDRCREQLREHLGEVHGYSRQSREELEAARREVQSELDRLRQRDLELRSARDEHRVAVAAFRHQLIDWQGRVDGMRQALAADGTKLQRRQADLEQRARQMEDASARLSEEAQSLEQAKLQVAQRRDEVDRHLGDMREWYRKKIRELAGVDLPPGEPGDGDVLPLPPPAAGPAPGAPGERHPARAVLDLDGDLEPADRELGEMLTSLGLIDADTRQALWAEARRQRRSLRQLLLAGGYLTLYQLALIEAGNLDGLVLGPVRVIDKLSSGPREAVYRVFDPRRNLEAVVRHLAESEMHDAVRPDEFRQRFGAAAAVRDERVAAVLEVLTVADRPAVVVEWVDGVPVADLPGPVFAPAVWHRLLSQAAAALQAAHAAGLAHGRLDGNALVLTPAGVLKLVGLGEPGWLGGSAADDSPEADLAALGRLAAGWAAPVKGSRGRAVPAELQAILDRLQADDPAARFGTAAELAEALAASAGAVPGGTSAWDRLLRQVREQVGGSPRRQSA